MNLNEILENPKIKSSYRVLSENSKTWVRFLIKCFNLNLSEAFIMTTYAENLENSMNSVVIPRSSGQRNIKAVTSLFNKGVVTQIPSPNKEVINVTVKDDILKTWLDLKSKNSV